MLYEIQNICLSFCILAHLLHLQFLRPKFVILYQQIDALLYCRRSLFFLLSVSLSIYLFIGLLVVKFVFFVDFLICLITLLL